MTLKGNSPRRKNIREARAVYQTRQSRVAGRSRMERAGRVQPDWQWVQANRARLEEQYAGRWIAVADAGIVGTGSRLATALKQAKAQGIDHPFVVAFKTAKYRDAVEVDFGLGHRERVLYLGRAARGRR